MQTPDYKKRMTKLEEIRFQQLLIFLLHNRKEKCTKEICMQIGAHNKVRPSISLIERAKYAKLKHFDAGDARKLLFMFASQLYFYVLGPISLLSC